jgi:hypothetical protein
MKSHVESRKDTGKAILLHKLDTDGKINELMTSEGALRGN